MRVTRSRELVAEGYRPSAVARVAQISRQAIYRPPKPRPARPPADEVEAVIVAEAEANPTDGFRMVCAWARRRLGRPVNRKRVQRPLQRRRRPGAGPDLRSLDAQPRRTLAARDVSPTPSSTA